MKRQFLLACAIILLFGYIGWNELLPGIKQKTNLIPWSGVSLCLINIGLYYIVCFYIIFHYIGLHSMSPSINEPNTTSTTIIYHILDLELSHRYKNTGIRKRYKGNLFTDCVELTDICDSILLWYNFFHNHPVEPFNIFRGRTRSLWNAWIEA